MRSIIFDNAVKHEKLTFIPGIPLGFEDEDAVSYFVALGWAKPSDKAPLHTYAAGEVNIDPETRQNATGLLVADLMQKGITNDG